eukprot:scaffold198909_cov55-Prasinocladus_malaysianus.AAC.1
MERFSSTSSRSARAAALWKLDLDFGGPRDRLTSALRAATSLKDSLSLAEPSWERFTVDCLL